MSALKTSSFKRALLFAAACCAVAGTVAPARADSESAETAALRVKAEKGNGIAQFNLGLAYTQGRDVPIDPIEAFVWLSLAAENGTTGKALESVIGKLTDDQLADGQRRLIARRIALSATPAAPAAGATRVGGAVKASTGGFNLSHPVVPAPPGPEDSAPKAAAPEPPPSRLSPPAPPNEPARTPAPAAIEQNSRDPSSGLLQIIGTLRDEKQQLGMELSQTRNELGKTRADLAAVNSELASLRTDITRLEAASSAAKLTETRLTVELNAAKSADGTVTAETPKTDEHPSHLP